MGMTVRGVRGSASVMVRPATGGRLVIRGFLTLRQQMRPCTRGLDDVRGAGLWEGPLVPETSFSQLAGRPVPATGSGGYQVPMWRAIAVFRFVALGYVVVLALRNLSQYARPAAAVAALLVMAGWTVFTAYAYAQPGPRRWPLLTADLVIALAALLVTPFVVGRAALNAGVPTLGIAWLAAPVLAWAVWGGRRRGIAAALVLGAADLTVLDADAVVLHGDAVHRHTRVHRDAEPAKCSLELGRHIAILQREQVRLHFEHGDLGRVIL